MLNVAILTMPGDFGLFSEEGFTIVSIACEGNSAPISAHRIPIKTRSARCIATSLFHSHNPAESL
jgi:hypothetical protein